MSRASLFFLVAASLVVSCSEQKNQLPPVVVDAPDPEPVAFSEATQGRINHYFDSLQRYMDFNGVVLAYHNDSLMSFSRGLRSFESGDSLRTTDAFQLASVSKPLTAYAVLRLIDQGVLHPANLVSQYLEGFPYSDVTVGMLLNHTSGLGNYTYVTDSLWGMPDSVMTNDDLLREFIAGHIPVYYPPGRQFDYCNSNYFLLAAIIDCTVGMAFPTFMEREVFGPLGMAKTSILDPGTKDCLDYAVQGHYPNGKNKLPFYLNGVTGDKGVYSTVDDLFAFYKEWQRPKHLSQEVISQSFSEPVQSGTEQFYGWGWRLKPQADGDTLVFHNGWWRGFRSYFWWSRKDDRCFIALTNSIRGGYLDGEEIIRLY